MADFDISLKRCDVPEKVRARALSLAYQTILLWELKTEPTATETLAGDGAAGSETNTPAVADGTPPATQQATDKKDSGGSL